MDIHVVKTGETIDEIATRYGVSAEKIIQDNELDSPHNLVPGQTIVIAYPINTYTVQDGDSLHEIAYNNHISVMQLLKNNPFLSDREYIYPGETLVLDYDNTKGKMTVGGFAYPHIDKSILIKTLPFLTYLSIFNYTITTDAEVISYYDDTEIIQTCKNYGVAPLMLLTTLTTRGVPNIEAVHEILLDEETVDKFVDIIVDLGVSKGYYGVNISFQYLNTTNEHLYLNLLKKISAKSYALGSPLFVTINPNKIISEGRVVYDPVNYSGYDALADNINFMSYQFGYNYGPPAPVGSINNVQELINYVLHFISPDKVSVGFPSFGYNWELPYVIGFSSATSLSLDSILHIARNVGAEIEFDELSHTPYIRYTDMFSGIQHIIWFTDARSYNSLMNLITENNLQGTGIWNIMKFYPQLWLVLNSQYEIEKVIL